MPVPSLTDPSPVLWSARGVHRHFLQPDFSDKCFVCVRHLASHSLPHEPGQARSPGTCPRCAPPAGAELSEAAGTATEPQLAAGPAEAARRWWDGRPATERGDGWTGAGRPASGARGSAPRPQLPDLNLRAPERVPATHPGYQSQPSRHSPAAWEACPVGEGRPAAAAAPLPSAPAPAAPLWGGGLAARIRRPYPRAAPRLAHAHTPGLPSPRPPTHQHPSPHPRPAYPRRARQPTSTQVPTHVRPTLGSRRPAPRRPGCRRRPLQPPGAGQLMGVYFYKTKSARLSLNRS